MFYSRLLRLSAPPSPLSTKQGCDAACHVKERIKKLKKNLKNVLHLPGSENIVMNKSYTFVKHVTTNNIAPCSSRKNITPPVTLLRKTLRPQQVFGVDVFSRHCRGLKVASLKKAFAGRLHADARQPFLFRSGNFCFIFTIKKEVDKF